MGQYYHPISLDKKESVYSHDYGSGLKLMEHSWIGNGFVEVVERLIAKGGAWFGSRIVWAGDYADPEKDAEGNDMKIEHEGKLYDLNLYGMYGDDKHKIKPVFEKLKGRKLRFLKNLDTKEFVDLNKVPADGDGWNIHPLPLLTCEGNGRGGGDYHKESELVGKWARNRVVMQRNRPRSGKELVFDLIE